MNYIKKMCILRQVKQGFSGDGKALSGLIKIEQYGKNLAVEVSIINFAPLVSGEYYCLLSDGKGKTEMLALRGKSLFNLLSDLDISSGFCGIICYVKNDIVPIAYGINGNGSYDWRSILNATLPPVFPNISQENALSDADLETFLKEKEKNQALTQASKEENKPPMYALNEKNQDKNAAQSNATIYNDDSVALENYYAKEQVNEQEQSYQNIQNAQLESTSEKQSTTPATDLKENGNADSVLHPFERDPDGYYLSVKSELDELFRSYPRDTTLNGAFSCCEWVRLKGTAKQPQYLVGVLYQDGKAKYVCYALAAEDKNNPPEEIKNVCTFVPCSLLKESEGFFVLFQSAATGECIKPLET